MMTSPFLTINCSCDEALQWSQQQLSQAGWHLVQTFDLQAARAASHTCACPNHGTDACDCQMVVMLVYGTALEPATLILHGSDGQTWLSLADDTNPGNAGIVSLLQNSLSGHSLLQK